MRMRVKKVLGGAAIAAVVALTCVIGLAQQGPQGGPPPDGPHGHGHFGPSGPGGPGGPGGDLFGPIGRELNLTDAQRAQIRQLEDSFRDSTRSLSEKMRTLHENEMASLISGTFDEAAVRANAQERAATQVELDVAHAKLMSQILGVLTADQKAKLVELHKQMGAHHGGDHPGDNQ